MPIFDVEMREVTVYRITVQAPTRKAAESYGKLYAPNHVVFAGSKPVEETGVFFQATRDASGDPDLEVNECGEEIIE